MNQKCFPQILFADKPPSGPLTPRHKDFHRRQNFHIQCHKRFFCLNLELLSAVICLTWLADDLFIKAMLLTFGFSISQHTKPRDRRKLRKQKQKKKSTRLRGQ